MIKSLVDEESIEDVESPQLVAGEEIDELLDFVLEYFAAYPEEKEEIDTSEPFLSESEFLDKMDEILAIVTDDNMDSLADIVAGWIL